MTSRTRHEVFEEFFSEIESVDSSELIDIISKKGEDWFLELVFKGNKRLVLAKNIPTHFLHSLTKEERKDLNQDTNQIFMGVINNE